MILFSAGTSSAHSLSWTLRSLISAVRSAGRSLPCTICLLPSAGIRNFPLGLPPCRGSLSRGPHDLLNPSRVPTDLGLAFRSCPRGYRQSAPRSVRDLVPVIELIAAEAS